MSTKLRDVPTTEIKQTRFYGGDERGVCIQISKAKHYPDNKCDYFNYFDYIQLTRAQAKLVAYELLRFSNEEEITAEEESDE